MPEHWTDEDKARNASPRLRLMAWTGENSQRWVTLDELGAEIGARRSGTVASRLRDMKAGGSYTYDRKRHPSIAGVFLYRIYPVEPRQLPLLEAVGL